MGYQNYEYIRDDIQAISFHLFRSLGACLLIHAISNHLVELSMVCIGHTKHTQVNLSSFFFSCFAVSK
jgi:hypothetical protein